MALRSIWNGTIAFGSVRVPIKLHSATQSKTVRFREVHEKDGAKLEHRRFCTKEDKEVPNKEVVRGFEVRPGKWVVLSKDEIEAAAGEQAKTIAIEEFVPAEDIDPIYLDKGYYLGAGEDGAQAYRLLLEALKETGQAGIGRFVFHNREYLVALRPHDSVLALHTLRFHDEVVDADDLDMPDLPRRSGQREVKMAGQLVKSLYADFGPRRYKDSYRKAVLALIEHKAKGRKIELPEPEEPEEQPDDLAAALEASLAGSG
jgi:DNA end-binding protein Ku